ncbi:DMT family transporter [Neptunomonas sp.]|uniref:DMT family transporter n=1 Tax=Neptunomonas sp. TaxID=1971898 RepID=UPI0025D754C9|nr:DMT family transporter [Neptunomonas sp.]
MNSTFFYASIMFVAGLGIPLMAALNGGLGAKLQSPALAATILFIVGLAVSVTYLFAVEGVSTGLYKANIPWYLYFGGFFVMFYILSITSVAPHFGISNAVSFVLLGQLVAMSFIDHYGLVGALQYSLTPKRLIGLALMGVGVFMVVGRSTSA